MKSGVQPDPIEFITVPAQRIQMGSRLKYKFAVQLSLAATLFPKIDPDKPFSSNREVEPKHGHDFAKYVEDNPDNWIEPGVLLVTQRNLDFISLGFQDLPKSSNSPETPFVETGELRFHRERTQWILLWMEGQHRNFGIQQKLNELNKEIGILEAKIEINPEDHEAKSDLEKVKNLLERFSFETMDVTIITPVEPQTQQQWFVTIAREAKGIIRAEKERMDDKSITVVAAKHVIEGHPLLAGSFTESTPKGSKTTQKVLNRVNRVPRSSAAIFTLPNITDVTKNIGFSWAKRATVKKESPELQDAIEKMTINFFDDLVDSISDYKRLTVDSGFTGKNLRNKTLYSSSTFIRVLADVYHRIAIATPDSKEDNEIGEPLEIIPSGRKLFKKLLVNLDPFMDYVERTDPENSSKTFQGVHDKWMATGLFRPKAKVPDSDTQGLGGLSDLLVEWAKKGNVFDPQTADKIESKPKGSI